MSVAVHHGDNLRKTEVKKKTVYKAVLDTPFILKWPFTPADRHLEIFKALCELLKPIGEARLERRKQRKQKIKATEQLPSSPTVITGFNEITRSLERKDPDDSDAIVFVCRSDTELPQLCSYYPQLCALAGRKLVPLQKGSETALAGVLGLKRVMGVQVKGSGDVWDRLTKLTSGIPTPSAPWLEHRYMPTEIKTLETTAPVINRTQPKNQQQMKRPSAGTESSNKKQKS
ncbi:hypothetical protein K450DRAFT_242254 [Umbelopsis ramanniana AG]|uniref:Uncharacterized protein n=1 Tax=Umbelopsis ramanniana AG TaxID=1314678 RepID=A0AAD5E8V7_UMBRA|nr:uncharacterized protein K450DRAFT_242254 [Umbelopsis ramanniana AG]KAI8579456.1 hypothetical protein K450DRAFT_242254 [Umbelopsis ramanniana AG]